MMPAIQVENEIGQIGAELRSAREAAGLGVDDVVFRTQIPRSVVEALEAEDFTAFACPVYAKSFLSQYSEFLNVDAQPWLDALEPGSFVAGGQLRDLFEGPDSHPEDRAGSPEHRGGLLSVLGLLTFSAAVVVGAIKGYEFFEKRLGGKEPLFIRGSEPAVSPPSVIPKAPQESEPVVENEDEQPEQGTPRAIIVR
jgi:cytoskeletal protein RodZ